MILKNTDESIINSYALGDDVTGEKKVGGLVGINGGALESCYAGGRVRGDKISGGLVGFNIKNITDCYAKGDVIGDYQIGKIINIYINNTLLEVIILAKEDKLDLIDEIYNNLVKSIKLEEN